MSPGHVPRAGSAAAAPGPVASSQLFRRPTLLWGADDLAARAGAPTTWLWHGYLAPGGLTLLFGRCHAGKTRRFGCVVAGRGYTLLAEPKSPPSRNRGERAFMFHRLTCR